MTLHLYSSNRLEELAYKCAHCFKEDPLPPMEKETIVVQSLGMMQWLSIKLSEHIGIWADFEYLFPNKFTSFILKSFFTDLPDSRFFDKDVMAWKIVGLLRNSKDSRIYKKLYDYISNDVSNIKEYQISRRVADLMDQYMTFRPGMILRWDEGKVYGEEKWQYDLWKEITADADGIHPPALLESLFKKIADGNALQNSLPKRFTVFGISYIPLYHFDILRALSFVCDVHIYILNPCQYDWSNIQKEKEITSLILKLDKISENYESELHIERGNPLLASMGKIGRDFFKFLYMSVDDANDDSDFIEASNDSLLHIIQNDILNLKEKDPKNKVKIKEDDQSILINSCHSIMREVEVLHDYIISLFEGKDDISANDILVMTPDIESYSSAIYAVFDRGDVKIPYTIVDRNITKTSVGLSALFKILDIGQSRFTSSEVMSILQCPLILKKFGLSKRDFDLISSWVMNTNIFWGIDDNYKKDLGLIEIYENTWKFGIERMLLGSIMYDADSPVFDILPFCEIEGGDMVILGRFISFLKSLFDVYFKICGEYSLSLWASIIRDIIYKFFDDEESFDDFLFIIENLERLKVIEEQSGFTGAVGILPIINFTEENIPKESSGKNFITGKVTFCEMLPMRSIPAKVICLLGMNEYSFPRKSKSLEFDLISKNPRIGDRNIRDEDKYLFLETILSARERLYISFIGQDITSGKEHNPSIVVSELMDYIDDFFETESGKDPIDFILKKQKLQSYHPDYFFVGDNGIKKFFTYSSLNYNALQSYLSRIKGGREEDYVFFDKELPELSEKEKNILIDDLVEFLHNPSKYFIAKRLGVRLDTFISSYKEEEIFNPDNLEFFLIKEEILRLLLDGYDKDYIFKKITLKGIIPHGNIRGAVFDEAFYSSFSLYKKIENLLGKKEEILVDMNILDYRITGSFTLINGRQIFFRSGKLRGKDRLQGWIYHLFACTQLKRDFESFETSFIAEDTSCTYKFAQDAEEIIKSLLEIYSIGMKKPIPLFPKTSFAYCEQIHKKTPKGEEAKDKAIKHAKSEFDNDFSYGSDLSDPYIQKFFNSDSLNEDFIQLAEKVYSPMYKYIAE